MVDGRLPGACRTRTLRECAFHTCQDMLRAMCGEARTQSKNPTSPAYAPSRSQETSTDHGPWRRLEHCADMCLALASSCVCRGT